MLNIEGVRLEHQRRFEAILRRHGASGLGIAQCFTSIVKSYQEPHRGHHDNQHITEMHYLQDCWGSEIEDRDTMFIATEYHDMVYRVALPGRPKWADENQSIVRMGSDLARLGVSMDFIDGVARLIDISKPGAMPRLTDDEKIFHV